MSEINQIIFKYIIALVANLYVGNYLMQNYPEYNMYSLPIVAITIIYISYNNYNQIYR